MAQVDVEVLAAKTATSRKGAIMAGAIAHKVVQINRIEIQGRGIKRNRNVITTKRNLVIHTLGQTGARNPNQKKPLNLLEGKETIVAIVVIVQEAAIEDRITVRVLQL